MEATQVAATADRIDYTKLTDAVSEGREPAYDKSTVWRAWNKPNREFSRKLARLLLAAGEALGYEVPAHVRERATVAEAVAEADGDA